MQNLFNCPVLFFVWFNQVFDIIGEIILKKILLIEDNVMNSELVKDILEMESYEITSVSNGREALDILENVSFDLILTDINLPKMDGVEFIKRVRSNSDKTLIIAMSSDLATKDGQKFEDVGFNGYIQKPFKINEFRQYVKSLLT